MSLCVFVWLVTALLPHLQDLCRSGTLSWGAGICAAIFLEFHLGGATSERDSDAVVGTGDGHHPSSNQPDRVSREGAAA